MPRIKTSVSLDPRVLKELQKAAIDRDVNQSVALEDAIRLWLSHGTGPIEGALEGDTVSYPAELKDEIDVLLRLSRGPSEGPEHADVQYLVRRIVDRMLGKR